MRAQSVRPSPSYPTLWQSCFPKHSPSVLPLSSRGGCRVPGRALCPAAAGGAPCPPIPIVSRPVAKLFPKTLSIRPSVVAPRRMSRFRQGALSGDRAERPVRPPPSYPALWQSCFQKRYPSVLPLSRRVGCRVSGRALCPVTGRSAPTASVTVPYRDRAEKKDPLDGAAQPCNDIRGVRRPVCTADPETVRRRQACRKAFRPAGRLPLGVACRNRSGAAVLRKRRTVAPVWQTGGAGWRSGRRGGCLSASPAATGRAQLCCASVARQRRFGKQAGPDGVPAGGTAAAQRRLPQPGGRGCATQAPVSQTGGAEGHAPAKRRQTSVNRQCRQAPRMGNRGGYRG